MSNPIRISLTTWFADEASSKLLNGQGIVGHLTDEQYETVLSWLHQLALWTDEDREREKEHE